MAPFPPPVLPARQYQRVGHFLGVDDNAFYGGCYGGRDLGLSSAGQVLFAQIENVSCDYHWPLTIALICTDSVGIRVCHRKARTTKLRSQCWTCGGGVQSGPRRGRKLMTEPSITLAGVMATVMDDPSVITIWTEPEEDHVDGLIAPDG